MSPYPQKRGKSAPVTTWLGLTNTMLYIYQHVFPLFIYVYYIESVESVRYVNINFTTVIINTCPEHKEYKQAKK